MRGNIALGVRSLLDHPTVLTRSGGSPHEGAGPEMIRTEALSETWRSASSARRHTWLEIDYSAPDPMVLDPASAPRIPLGLPSDLLVLAGLSGLDPDAWWRVRRSETPIADREITEIAASDYKSPVNVEANAAAALAVLAADPFAPASTWLTPIDPTSPASFRAEFSLPPAGLAPGVLLQSVELLARRRPAAATSGDQPKLRIRIAQGASFVLDSGYFSLAGDEEVLTFPFTADGSGSGSLFVFVELQPVQDSDLRYLEVGALRLAATAGDFAAAEVDSGWMRLWPEMVSRPLAQPTSVGSPNLPIVAMSDRRHLTTAAHLYWPPEAEPGESESYRFTQIDLWTGSFGGDGFVEVGRVYETPALTGWFLAADWSFSLTDRSVVVEAMDGTPWVDELPIQLEVALSFPDVDSQEASDLLQVGLEVGTTRDVVVVIYPENDVVKKLLVVVGRFSDPLSGSGTDGEELDLAGTLRQRVG